MPAPLILVEASPRRASTGVVVPVRLAGAGGNVAYRYGGEHWRAGLTGLPTNITALDFDGLNLGGGGVPRAVELRWAPAGNARLAELAGLVWADAAIAVRVGQAGAALPPITLTGTVVDSAVDAGQLRLALADPAVELKKALLVDRFAGTGGLEGPPDFAGDLKSRAWGPCWNVPGRPLDPATNIWCFGDPMRPWQAIDAVRDMGLGAAIEQLPVLDWKGSAEATFAALQAASAPKGGGVRAPSIACVKWWTAPSGDLHADIRGETAGGYVDTAPAIAARLLAARSTIPLAAGTLDAAIAARPAVFGYRVTDESTTAAAAISEVLGDVSTSWLLQDGAVVLRPWSWGAPVVAARSHGVTRRQSFKPVGTRRLGYRRNQHPMARGDLAAAVFVTDIELPDGTSLVDTVVKVTDPGVLTAKEKAATFVQRVTDAFAWHDDLLARVAGLVTVPAPIAAARATMNARRAAYVALLDQLNPAWDNVAADSPIDRADETARWTAWQTALNALDGLLKADYVGGVPADEVIEKIDYLALRDAASKATIEEMIADGKLNTFEREFVVRWRDGVARPETDALVREAAGYARDYKPVLDAFEAIVAYFAPAVDGNNQNTTDINPTLWPALRDTWRIAMAKLRAEIDTISAGLDIVPGLAWNVTGLAFNAATGVGSGIGAIQTKQAYLSPQIDVKVRKGRVRVISAPKDQLSEEWGLVFGADTTVKIDTPTEVDVPYSNEAWPAGATLRVLIFDNMATPQLAVDVLESSVTVANAQLAQKGKQWVTRIECLDPQSEFEIVRYVARSPVPYEGGVVGGPPADATNGGNTVPAVISGNATRLPDGRYEMDSGDYLVLAALDATDERHDLGSADALKINVAQFEEVVAFTGTLTLAILFETPGGSSIAAQVDLLKDRLDVVVPVPPEAKNGTWHGTVISNSPVGRARLSVPSVELVFGYKPPSTQPGSGGGGVAAGRQVFGNAKLDQPVTLYGLANLTSGGWFETRRGPAGFKRFALTAGGNSYYVPPLRTYPDTSIPLPQPNGPDDVSWVRQGGGLRIPGDGAAVYAAMPAMQMTRGTTYLIRAIVVGAGHGIEVFAAASLATGASHVTPAQDSDPQTQLATGGVGLTGVDKGPVDEANPNRRWREWTYTVSEPSIWASFGLYNGPGGDAWWDEVQVFEQPPIDLGSLDPAAGDHLGSIAPGAGTVVVNELNIDRPMVYYATVKRNQTFVERKSTFALNITDLLGVNPISGNAVVTTTSSIRDDDVFGAVGEVSQEAVLENGRRFSRGGYYRADFGENQGWTAFSWSEILTETAPVTVGGPNLVSNSDLKRGGVGFGYINQTHDGSNQIPSPNPVRFMVVDRADGGKALRLEWDDIPYSPYTGGRLAYIGVTLIHSGDANNLGIYAGGKYYSATLAVRGSVAETNPSISFDGGQSPTVQYPVHKALPGEIIDQTFRTFQWCYAWHVSNNTLGSVRTFFFVPVQAAGPGWLEFADFQVQEGKTATAYKPMETDVTTVTLEDGSTASDAAIVTEKGIAAGTKNVDTYLVGAKGNGASGPQGYLHGLRKADGSAIVDTYARSYEVLTYNRQTKVWNARAFDVYGNGEINWGFGTGAQSNAAGMAMYLNALVAGTPVVIYTSDEPGTHRLESGLPEAIYRCGGSRGVFAKAWFTHAAYVLIGTAGIGEGKGVEQYADGGANFSAQSWLQLSFTMVGGVMTGRAQTIVSASDLVFGNGRPLTELENVPADADKTISNIPFGFAPTVQVGAGLGTPATPFYVSQPRFRGQDDVSATSDWTSALTNNLTGLLDNQPGSAGRGVLTITRMAALAGIGSLTSTKDGQPFRTLTRLEKVFVSLGSSAGGPRLVSVPVMQLGSGGWQYGDGRGVENKVPIYNTAAWTAVTGIFTLEGTYVGGELGYQLARIYQFTAAHDYTEQGADNTCTIEYKLQRLLQGTSAWEDFVPLGTSNPFFDYTVAGSRSVQFGNVSSSPNGLFYGSITTQYRVLARLSRADVRVSVRTIFVTSANDFRSEVA